MPFLKLIQTKELMTRQSTACHMYSFVMQCTAAAACSTPVEVAGRRSFSTAVRAFIQKQKAHIIKSYIDLFFYFLTWALHAT